MDGPVVYVLKKGKRVSSSYWLPQLLLFQLVPKLGSEASSSHSQNTRLRPGHT